jgi:hypothetical protein
MKCIKALRDNNSYKKDYITRVENKEADLKVSTGYWTFIPKSEWKIETRGETISAPPKTSTKKNKTKKQK